MLNLVNGYVCRTPEDAELAKRGVDPMHVPQARLLGATTPNPRAEEPVELPHDTEPTIPLSQAEQLAPAELAVKEEQASPPVPPVQRRSIEPGVGIKLDVVG